jgi:hypothetical protein
MNAKTIRLIDAAGRLLGVARVTDEGKYYGGTIDLTPTPPDVRSLFEQFEELVNNQEFPCADAIEAKIDALAIRGVADDGTAELIATLHVFPETANVSFTMVATSGTNGSVTHAKMAVPE